MADQSGANNPNWRGGIAWGEGYAYIWKPGYHRQQKGRLQSYAKRADLVLEEKLGRLLEPNEIAHHKNEDKADDSPDNLEVMTVSEHRKYHNHKTSRETVRSDSTLGITGVTYERFRSRPDKYRLRISVNGQRLDIGFFMTLEEAIEARKLALSKLDK